MFKAFNDAMIPYFRADTINRSLLLSRQLVCRLKADTASIDDPFLSMILVDGGTSLTDQTAVDSFWHVATHSLNPKKSSFRRMLVDARSEPQFKLDEIKLSALTFI